MKLNNVFVLKPFVLYTCKVSLPNPLDISNRHRRRIFHITLGAWSHLRRAVMEVEFKAMLDDLDVLEKSLSDPAPIHKVLLQISFIPTLFTLCGIKTQIAILFLCGFWFVLFSLISREVILHMHWYLRVVLILIWLWILLIAFILIRISLSLLHICKILKTCFCFAFWVFKLQLLLLHCLC